MANATAPQELVRSHEVAVLFIRRSRDAYAAEAAARDEIYTFTDAWGRPRDMVRADQVIE